MAVTQTGERQLRLWPGVGAVLLQWLVPFGVAIAAPEAMALAVMGGIGGGLVAVTVWWALFSRAPWGERVGAVVLMIAVAAATTPMLHPSIRGGMMGMMFGIYVIPGLCLALVVWAAATRRMADGPRRVTLAAAVVVACGVWTLVRTDGITGEGRPQFAWRWEPTSEQQLVARAASAPAAPAPAPAAAAKVSLPVEAHGKITGPVHEAPIAWAGFRGPHRDGAAGGVRIRTDWVTSPPVELWRRAVGPGWSSFAAGGGLIYTQEQRGEYEVAACYNAATGKPVWTHRDTARFWESNAGAGPRGTPALHGGRVYTFGATGIVNALDANSGALVWTRNAAADTGAELPGWGFASSPLVVDGLAVVAASGRLAAYDLATGAPRWIQRDGRGSYSSPHLLTLSGVAQIVFLNNGGAMGVAPADGKVLWQHPWEGSAMLQPALAGDGGVLLATGDMSGGMGVRRLAVANGPGGWAAEEVWTSRGLKPYFNDFVVHSGHAFGFDGSILACIGLDDGKRKWKGGRYGHGQLLLLPGQDLLLVLSEEGELALVAAVAGEFTEVARFRAMEDKTWNHPVLAGDILLVRNGREMVAFRLAVVGE